VEQYKKIKIMKMITLEGVNYKSKTRFPLKNDLVSMLPYSLVIAGVIGKDEWARNNQKIVDRFNITIEEVCVDGRKKEIKSLPYFTWNVLTTLNK
jgi:hypothetical protein